jgi:hypothetical protein
MRGVKAVASCLGRGEDGDSEGEEVVGSRSATASVYIFYASQIDLSSLANVERVQKSTSR